MTKTITENGALFQAHRARLGLAGHDQQHGRGLLPRNERREIIQHCNDALKFPRARVVNIKRENLSRFKK